MTSCRNWKYKQTDIVKKLEELFSCIENGITINKWYLIDDKLIYENSKFFYHFVIPKKSIRGFYLEDYVCSKDGQLRFSTEYGYFKTNEEIKEFLKGKGINE